MRWLRPSSEADMVALFLRTELPSARWQDGLPSGGTRLAVDAAPRIRAGVAPFGVHSDWALAMAQAVAADARFPSLILVTTGLGGDLVVLEGHCRLTAFMLARDWLPPELEVLVGSSPAMTRWGCW